MRSRVRLTQRSAERGSLRSEAGRGGSGLSSPTTRTGSVSSDSARTSSRQDRVVGFTEAGAWAPLEYRHWATSRRTLNDASDSASFLTSTKTDVQFHSTGLLARSSY